MKKYFIGTLLVVFFLTIGTNLSYAHQPCDSYSIDLKEINTNNFTNFYNNNYPNKELLKICSHYTCYNVNKGDIKTTVQDFFNYVNKKSTLDRQEVAFVKGYPITKIIINNCNP